MSFILRVKISFRWIETSDLKSQNLFSMDKNIWFNLSEDSITLRTKQKLDDWERSQRDKLHSGKQVWERRKQNQATRFRKETIREMNEVQVLKYITQRTEQSV